MRADKVISTSMPLRAVSPLLRAVPAGEKVPVTPFLEYYRDRLAKHGSMPASRAGEHERAIAALVAEADGPDPIGQAYLAGLREAIALAEADGWHGFDHVRVDDLDQSSPSTAAMYVLHQQLEERSVLLEPVAQAVLDMMPVDGMTLATVAEISSRVAADSPVLGLGPVLDNDHETCRATSSVSWNDVELLLPGTRDQLRDLVTATYADLPTPAADPQTSTRFPEPTEG